MSDGDGIMLLAEAMGTALDDVQFRIGIGLLCLPGIIQLHDIVVRSMDDQHRATIGLNFCNGIHVDHISHIAPSQLHGAAVDAFRNVLDMYVKYYNTQRPNTKFNGGCILEDE